MKLTNNSIYRHIDSDLTTDRQKKENKFKKNFGLNLQKYLSENNIKIDTFANEIGYDRQHVYGICSGKKAPSLFCLWRITENLNVSTEYLFNLGLNNFAESNSSSNNLEIQKLALIDKINSIDDLRVIEHLLANLEYTNSIMKNSVESDTTY